MVLIRLSTCISLARTSGILGNSVMRLRLDVADGFGNSMGVVIRVVCVCQGDAFERTNIANSRTGGVWLPAQYDLTRVVISREQVLAIQVVQDPSPDRIRRAELQVDAWSSRQG